jgi:hypothetical protein
MSHDFFGWLAVQPSFLQVEVGALFCLSIAPAVMAGVAIIVTALETLAEKYLTSLLASRPANAVNDSPAFLPPKAVAQARGEIVS